MKKYLKEIIIVLIQLFIFYIIPLFTKTSDTIGMVTLIILVTLLLSITLGTISNNKIKYAYPILVSLLFIPSIWIYYNESALIHSVWYLIISTIGLLIGVGINRLINKNSKNY